MRCFMPLKENIVHSLVELEQKWEDSLKISISLLIMNYVFPNQLAHYKSL